MCPVQKTSIAPESGIPSHLADPVLIKRLNEQNLWEVLSTLPGDYTKQDVIDYLKFRNEQLRDLIQNDKTMSLEAEPREIEPQVIGQAGANLSLSREDEAELRRVFSEMSGERASAVARTGAPDGRTAAKFAMAPKAAGGGESEAKDRAPNQQELEEGYSEVMKDYETWADDWMNTVFDIQLQQQMEKKNEELKSEMQRVLALVRSGKADAVFILIALAKVNIEKNGLLFTQYGQKMTRMNQESTKVMNDLFSSGKSNDPASLQVASVEQRNIATNQQFLMQDMQKITQHIENTFGFARQSVDDIFKTQLQLRNSFSRQ